jgi:peptidyl-tRNA hydrolase
MANFVLARFTKEEFEVVNKNIEFAVELIEKFISGGYKEMLDFYSNAKKKSLDSIAESTTEIEEKGSFPLNNGKN